MSAEGGSAVAVEVMGETEQGGTEATTVDKRVCGGNQGDGGEGGTAKVIADPRWHVEAYMERWGVMIDRRRSQAMEVDSSSRCIYDRRRLRYDTCVWPRRRRWGVFDRNRAVLLAGVSSLAMPFVRCEEEITCCQKSK